MKNILCICVVLLLLLSLSACALEEEKTPEAQNPTVVRTFEENENEHTWVTYYEMSDGTWKTDNCAYKYCLELSGKVPGTDSVWVFTVLSNREDLTFDDAFWASGFSSNLSDYFSPEEARIVRTNFSISES